MDRQIIPIQKTIKNTCIILHHLKNFILSISIRWKNTHPADISGTNQIASQINKKAEFVQLIDLRNMDER